MLFSIRESIESHTHHDIISEFDIQRYQRVCVIPHHIPPLFTEQPSSSRKWVPDYQPHRCDFPEPTVGRVQINVRVRFQSWKKKDAMLLARRAQLGPTYLQSTRRKLPKTILLVSRHLLRPPGFALRIGRSAVDLGTVIGFTHFQSAYPVVLRVVAADEQDVPTDH